MTERLLKDFADISPTWFWEMDADLRFTYFSGRLEVLAGVNLQNEVGKSRLDIAANAQNREFWQSHIDDLLARRTFRDFTYPYRHPDGRIRWFQISGQPHFDQDGQFLGYRGVGTDVTVEREATARLDETLSVLRRTNRAYELVNSELSRQNQRLTSQEAALSAQTNRLETTLEAMYQGLLMLDSELRVTVFNRRFADMIGYTPGVLRVGATTRELVAEAVALGHHPGRTVDEAWSAWQARLQHHVASSHEQLLGDGRTLSVSYAPMDDGGWVITYEDISERKRAQAEIDEQNRRLDVALSNMAQGLCMFDSDLRLLVCNRRYCEILGLSPEVAKPGSALRDLIEHGVAIGRHPGRTVDELMEERLAVFREGRPAMLQVRVTGGRIIETAYRPMAGGGWVATYDDVTDREQAKERLREQREQLDAALNNMAQGLCMFDADMRIIVFNDQFIEILNFSPEVVRPGTSLLELFEHTVAIGNIDGPASQRYEEYLAELVGNGSLKMQRRLNDGRIIAINHRPSAGGGWVSTYEDITEQKRTEARIAHMARHDALTNLPNRVLFREKMDEALARVRRGENLAALCIDLDHFKAVNDTLGHPIGDALLQAVTARLHNCVRETDTIARLGGDEFAILQVGIERPEQASSLARRIIAALSAPYDLNGHQVVIGASVGIAIAPNDGLDPDILLKNADMALYRAKTDGRGTYRFFEPDMDARLQARRSLELDLRKALVSDEFELYYQPLIELKTDRVAGFEALLRWNHPERGMVSPAEFIPLAEEIGLIVPLGEWVVRQACRDAASWPQGVRVAVNLSPAQFKSRTLLHTVIAALGDSGLAPQRLELEITESVLLQDNEATLATLHQLRGLGVRIAMDDFGTGYSSLSYLRSFPFDKIKIDRSFVQELSDRSDCTAIIRAVAGLGSSLGIVTTAEGVETAEQLRQVRAEGCTEVQGYLFSKPKPARDLGQFFVEARPGLESAA